MALSDDIAGDYAVIDGTETVSLESPGQTTIEEITALVRPIKYQGELVVALGLQPTDIVIHLWVATLSGATPKKGDTIRRSDTVGWIIVSAELQTLVTRWRCFCRQEVTEG